MRLMMIFNLIFDLLRSILLLALLSGIEAHPHGTDSSKGKRCLPNSCPLPGVEQLPYPSGYNAATCPPPVNVPNPFAIGLTQAAVTKRSIIAGTANHTEDADPPSLLPRQPPRLSLQNSRLYMAPYRQFRTSGCQHASSPLTPRLLVTYSTMPLTLSLRPSSAGNTALAQSLLQNKHVSSSQDSRPSGLGGTWHLRSHVFFSIRRRTRSLYQRAYISVGTSPCLRQAAVVRCHAGFFWICKISSARRLLST